MDGEAALQGVQSVQSIVERFLFLNVIASLAEQFSCTLHNCMLRLSDQARNPMLAAFQKGGDVEIFP